MRRRWDDPELRASVKLCVLLGCYLLAVVVSGALWRGLGLADMGVSCG
jgi:hypothetical protein